MLERLAFAQKHEFHSTFFSFFMIVAIVTTNSFTDKVPEEKACALRDKNA